MATVNAASLRERLDDCRVRFDDIRRRGEAGADTLALINALFLLLDILVAVFLERATPKTSANSSLPPSQTDGDGTARRAGGDTNGKGAQPNGRPAATCAGPPSRRRPLLRPAGPAAPTSQASTRPTGSAASCTTSSSRPSSAAWTPRSRTVPRAGPGPGGGSPTACPARSSTAPASRPSPSTC